MKILYLKEKLVLSLKISKIIKKHNIKGDKIIFNRKTKKLFCLVGMLIILLI